VVDERTAHTSVVTGGTNRSGNTLSEHGRVTVLDARSGRVLQAATIAAFPIAAVVDARVGRLLVADGTYGPVNAVSVLDTHSGALVRSVRVRAMGVSFFMAVPLAVDTHSDRAFLVNRSSNSVSVLATRSGTLLRTVLLCQPGRRAGSRERSCTARVRRATDAHRRAGPGSGALGTLAVAMGQITAVSTGYGPVIIAGQGQMSIASLARS
jgi:hypothetical protein